MRYLIKGVDRTTGQRAERLVTAPDRDEAMSVAMRGMVVRSIELDTEHRPELAKSPAGADGPAIVCPDCGYSGPGVRRARMGLLQGLALFTLGGIFGELAAIQGSGYRLCCPRCKAVVRQ